MENRLGAEQYGRPFRPTTLPTLATGTRPTPPGSSPTSQDNVILNTESSEPLDTPATTPSSSRRIRRERGPNWTASEVLVLIHAKREQHLQDLDTADARDLMRTERSKWSTVAQAVNESGFSPVQRDGNACKTKWNQLYPDYKKIADYLNQTGRNTPDFWSLSPTERRAQSLPRHYSEEFFVAIHEWCAARPHMNPVHFRDNLRAHDRNFSTQNVGHDNDHHSDSDTENEDPLVAHQEPVNLSTDGSSPPHTQGTTYPQPRPAPSQPTRSQNRTSAFAGVPTGVTPHVLSSSSTGNQAAQNRLGNTVVRRKSLSGPALIANATKTTGTFMSSQMKEIADANLQFESTKMDIPRQLFSEQMMYHRERDRIAQENATLVTENARLIVLKQHEMVQCLTEMTRVLERSLTSRGSSGHNRRHKVDANGLPRVVQVGATDNVAPAGTQSVAAPTGVSEELSEGAATTVPVTNATIEANGVFH